MFWPPRRCWPGVVDDPYRRSVALHFGCVLPAVRSPRDHLVHELLTEAMANMLARRLRVENNASPAPRVGAVWLRGGTAWLDGTVDADSKLAPQALAIVRGWFDRAQPFALDRQDFERVRWRKARRSALSNDTNGELASAIFDAWNMGWAPGVLDDYPRDLAAVSADDAIAAFATCRTRSVITVLAAVPIAYN